MGIACLIIMSRILLIERDAECIKIMTVAIHHAGHELADVITCRDVFSRASALCPDIAFVGLELSDLSLIGLIGSLQFVRSRPSCVAVMSEMCNVLLIEAVRAGAVDVIVRPVSVSDVAMAIDRVLARRAIDSNVRTVMSVGVEPHAMTPLVDAAMVFITSRTDARTLTQCARMIGTSVGALRNWCRSAGLEARRYLAFIRVLRAVVFHQCDSSLEARHLLMFRDPRTRAKVLLLAGGIDDALPGRVDDYLDNQRFLTDFEFLLAMRRRLVAAGVLELRSTR